MENVIAEIHSKPSCPYCVKAKQLLKDNNIQFNEKIVGVDSTKEYIQDMVDAMGENVSIRTVPQIFFHYTNMGRVEYIGGYDDLAKYFGS